MIGTVWCVHCARSLRVSDAWLSVICPHCHQVHRFKATEVRPDPYVLRGSSVVERGSHNPVAAGSIPAPATK